MTSVASLKKSLLLKNSASMTYYNFLKLATFKLGVARRVFEHGDVSPSSLTP
jgi:hypothetical protein